jgi:lipopolysaccharide export system permease protein
MDRYFIREMGLPFLFGVVAFTSIGTAVGSLFELVRLLVEEGLPLAIALKLYFLQAPRVIVLTFPMSMLMATLQAYNRLSGESEVTALRSCGVSTYRLVMPAFCLSLVVAACTFAFSEIVVPQANLQARAVMQAALEEGPSTFKDKDILYKEFEDVEVKQSDGSTDEEEKLSRLFFAHRFDGTTMKGVIVLDFSQPEFNQIILAQSGIWQPQSKAWSFADGTSYIVDEQGTYRNVLTFQRQQVAMPRTPLDIATLESSDAMTIAQLRERIRILSNSDGGTRLQSSRVELQRRYAIPFASVAFALVGAPLGLRKQRTSSALGLGLSILIVFGFYILSFIADALGQIGTLTPAVAAWLPNALTTAIGLGALANAARN